MPFETIAPLMVVVGTSLMGVLFLVMHRNQKRKREREIQAAKTYVLSYRPRIWADYEAAEQAMNLVYPDRLRSILGSKHYLEDLKELTPTSPVDWEAKADTLRIHAQKIQEATYYATQERMRREQARREGERLLERVPELISELESKIANAKRPSQHASTRLDSARAHLERARQRRDSDVLDDLTWLAIYQSLTSAQAEVSESSRYVDSYSGHSSSSHYGDHSSSHHDSGSSWGGGDSGGGSSGGGDGGGGGGGD